MMRYIINFKIETSVLAPLLREMKESGCDRSPLSSVSNNKLIYISYGLLPSKLSHGDYFLSKYPQELKCFPAIRPDFRHPYSVNGFFACKYHYREDEPMKIMQFDKLKLYAWGAGGTNIYIICRLFN